MFFKQFYFYFTVFLTAINCQILYHSCHLINFVLLSLNLLGAYTEPVPSSTAYNFCK